MGHIEFLADDALEGRNVGTPGFEGRRLRRRQFKEIGLKPGGVDGYRQPVKFESRTLVPEQSSWRSCATARRSRWRWARTRR